MLSSPTYLPVLGLQLQQHRVLSLALLAIVEVLDLLGALLGLDPVVLGKGSLVTGSAGVGQEVRANRLDAALDSTRELADGLEVLFGAPALGESRQREGDNLRDGSHFLVFWVFVWQKKRESKSEREERGEANLSPVFFFFFRPPKNSMVGSDILWTGGWFSCLAGWIGGRRQNRGSVIR